MVGESRGGRHRLGSRSAHRNMLALLTNRDGVHFVMDQAGYRTISLITLTTGTSWSVNIIKILLNPADLASPGVQNRAL